MFQFLCKTPIKILLNILINASYIFLTNISPERNINVAVIIFLQNLHEKKNLNCLYCIAFMTLRFVISVPKLLEKM